MPTPRAAVVSFPRSGTNLLCASIWKWFYVDMENLVLPEELLDRQVLHDEPGLYVIGGDANGIAPWGWVFAGHWFDPEAPAIKELMSERPIIYIVREGRKCLLSNIKLEVAKDVALDRPVLSIEEYLLRPHTPEAYGCGNPIPKVMNWPELWRWATDRWTKFPGILVVRYEDLTDIDKLPTVQKALSEFLGLPCLNNEVVGKIGYFPIGAEPDKIVWTDKAEHIFTTAMQQ